METDLIRKLDLILGKPACVALSWVDRVRRRARPHRHEPPRKILFIKLIEMGSTVLASPAFEAASLLVGQENLYLLVFKSNQAIADLLPYFRPNRVITIDDTGVAPFSLGLLAAITRIRKEGINVAIDMEGLTRSSAIIAYLTGARTRVGYHNFSAEGPYRGRLFTHELNYTFQHHVSEMFLGLVKALQAPVDQFPKLKEAIDSSTLRPPAFESTRAEQAEMRALLLARGAEAVEEVPEVRSDTNPRQVVILNPNCCDLVPLRKWPQERFLELGRRLLDAYPDLSVVVTGNPTEREAAEWLARAIGPAHRVISVAGCTTLRQLLVLYSISDVIVSSDSGPCHFAAMTEIHIVSLFGPETPQLYAPLGGRSTTITANLACSPCLNILNHRLSWCQDNRCMQAIPVSRVLEAVDEALAARRDDGR